MQKKESVKSVWSAKVPGSQKVWRPHPPDHAVLQAAGDDVDRHALRLVGEGHGADDFPAVHVADQVAVDGPQPQVAAAAHWEAEGQSSVASRSQSFIHPKSKNDFGEERVMRHQSRRQWRCLQWSRWLTLQSRGFCGL